MYDGIVGVNKYLGFEDGMSAATAHGLLVFRYNVFNKADE